MKALKKAHSGKPKPKKRLTRKQIMIKHEGGHLLMPTAYLRRWGADFWTMRSA